jgi:hypothetical protein
MAGTYIRTEEHRKKSSLSKLGINNPMFGKHLSKETKKKLSSAISGEKNYNFGKHLSDERKQKLRLANLEKKHSEESIQKMRIATGGKNNPNFGKTASLELRRKLSLSHIGKQLGEKSPSWKGGITPENKRIRHSFEYKEWRMKVFIRDSFTCQSCRLVGIYLEPHHIKSFAYYPKLRFETNNGITLCKECHKLTDNYKNKKRVY